MLDGHRLQMFLKVAEKGSINRAAEQMNITQSALSRHMKTLEDHLGFALLRRTALGVELTEAGKSLRGDMQEIFGTFNNAKRRAERIARGETGQLRLGLNDLAAVNSVVLEGITRFRQEHPDIRVHIDFIYSVNQIEKLHANEIDIGVMMYPPSDPDYTTTLMAPECAQIALPVGHPLASKSEITLSDLAQESFIVPSALLSPNYLSVVFRDFIANGYAPRIYQEAGSENQMVQMVSVGLGVAMMLRSKGSRPLPNVILRQIDWLNCAVPHGLVRRTSDQRPHVLQFCALFSQEDFS